MGLGTHGVITPDQARKSALEKQNEVGRGGDPLGKKRLLKNALRVSELLDAYTASPKFADKAELTQRYDKGRIQRHLAPLLGKKVAEKITSDDLRKAFSDIEKGKTAKTEKTGFRGLARVKGGPGAARMAIRLLKSAYTWATEQGLIKLNPTLGFKVGQDSRREVTLTQGEYKSLFETLDRLENEHKLRGPAADAIRVIALTGARRGEIAGLRWRHIDLQKGVILIPLKEHKTGKKTQENRVIGLPSAAQALIAKQPKGDQDSLVFQPSAGANPISLSKPWRLIREEAGLNSEIGLHGLRHALASQMAIAGAEAAQIMAVMGHKNIATSQRYIHIAQDARVDIAEKAAAGISAALTGDKLAEVVEIKEMK
jgi:integrase